MGSGQAVEYYTTVKRTGILTYATTWMNLEDIMAPAEGTSKCLGSSVVTDHGACAPGATLLSASVSLRISPLWVHLPIQTPHTGVLCQVLCRLGDPASVQADLMASQLPGVVDDPVYALPGTNRCSVNVC